MGFCTFDFAADHDAQPWVVVQATRAGFVGSVSVDPARQEISGFDPERQDAHLGPPAAAGFRGYFVARFDSPFSSFGTALGGALSDGSLTASGEEVAAYVRFAAGAQACSVGSGSVSR